MNINEGRAFTFGPCIGKGGFGEVYRGSMCSVSGLETEVAIKILHRDLNPNSQALKRLKDEGKLLARLNHPNILFVHDLVELGERWALITEYIDGEDLSSLCQTQHPLSPRSVVDIVGRIASALDAAWSTSGTNGPLHLIHRDIKPSNIRISRHGHVKLLDFGIARSDDQREAHTQTNLVVGSPPFMAPERFLSNRCDNTSDIFSLGATLYESITHERLFQDKSALNIATLALDDVLFDEFIEQRLKHSALKNEKLRRLVSSTLAHTPNDRPSAATVAVSCEEIAPHLAGETLKQWTRQHKWNRVSTDSAPHSALRGQTFSEHPRVTSDTTTPHRYNSKTISVWLETATNHPTKVIGLLLFVALTTILVGTGVGYTGLLAWKSLTVLHTEKIDPTSVETKKMATVTPEDSKIMPMLATEETDPSPKKNLQSQQTKKIQKKASPNTPNKAPQTTTPEPINLPSLGLVTSATNIPLTLKSGSNEFTLPASVTFGTYDIYATFSGDDAQWAGIVTVKDTLEISINCSERMRKCRPK